MVESTKNLGGAPEGNQNAAKGKRWQNAIDKALANKCKSDGQKALVDIATAMIDKCLDGDMTAIKEIGDRIDGKVAQTTVLEGNDEKPVALKQIERAIIDPQNTDS